MNYYQLIFQDFLTNIVIDLCVSAVNRQVESEITDQQRARWVAPI